MKTVAVIVNYKRADLTLGAVQSILDSESTGSVQVVVADNSEDADEAERLRQGLPSSVALLVNSRNIGFGRACNLAVERFPAEQILLVNPDARLLPGCLRRLQSTLSFEARTAAVSPRIFWDSGLRFLLPSSYPVSLLDIQALLVDSRGPQAHVSRLLSAVWRWHSIRIWKGRRPVRVKNLSGALVLLSASAVQRCGGLFDPRFFLYFEDTDLFLRLRRAGYSLMVDPRGVAIHQYDQCAHESREWKRSFMLRSRQLFLEKHHAWQAPLIRRLRFPCESPAPIRAAVPDFTSPFTLEVPGRLHPAWLFEWSPSPTLIPSSARFGAGPWMDFPETCWNLLAPGRYFGRIGAPRAFARTSPLISWEVRERIISERKTSFCSGSDYQIGFAQTLNLETEA